MITITRPIRPLITALGLAVAAACTPATLAPVSASRGGDMAAPAAVQTAPSSWELQAKARSFAQVALDLEPVIEAECRARAPQRNCDFQLVIDDRPGQPPNAFQTRDKHGRPVIGFTPGLILMAQNADELAFVMAHEAAHHIAGHLDQQSQDAARGAAVLEGMVDFLGGNTRSARQIGAAVGARTYSKQYELEADQLGAEILLRAGYDPRRGAQFFTRIPDPGDVFLGSHPANADRLRAVEAAISNG